MRTVHLFARRARALAAIVWPFLLILPASAIVPTTQWNLHIWQRLRAAHRDSPDIELDRRLRRLMPFLPPDGSIGFQVVGAPDNRRMEFRLKYTLAPRRIVRSVLPEFVIECGSERSSGSVGADHHFVLVIALDEDVRLYRRFRP